MQFFYDVADNFTTTTGIFWYDATIDQRGDFYSTLDSSRYRNPYVDQTGLLLCSARSRLASSRLETHATPAARVAESCQRNYARDNSNEQLALNGTGLRADNLVVVPGSAIRVARKSITAPARRALICSTPPRPSVRPSRPTPSGLGTSTKISPLPRGFATHLMRSRPKRTSSVTPSHC